MFKKFELIYQQFDKSTQIFFKQNLVGSYHINFMSLNILIENKNSKIRFSQLKLIQFSFHNQIIEFYI